MPLALQIELLSKAEVDEIWKSRGRAENFAEYLSFMNAREIGESFRIPIEKGPNNASAAREIRRNFNEAAKERAKGAVVLRWKVDKHTDKRTVKKDGKTVEEEVEVIDRLTALLISTEAVKHRAPRAKQEETSQNGVSEHTTQPAETANSAA